MTDLAVREGVPQAITDAMDALQNPETAQDDKAALWALLHQVQLRINRVLKAVRDDIIVGMERDGLKELGPLSIRSTAVDPVYECNAPGNWGDETIQSAMSDMKADPALGRYIRAIPAHLEIDVGALTEDIQLGVDAAIALYRELNRRRWRVEQARRLSLAVREVKPPKGTAAA